MVTVIDSTDMDWINGLDVLPTMPKSFRENLGPAEDLETMLSKYDVKPLLFEAETTRRIDLVQLKPGYVDLTDAYHGSVEECFVLDGECAVEEQIRRGDYFWRPPGWVHSAHSSNGMLALLMMEGVSPGDASSEATRVIRPSSEAGTNLLFDDHEAAIGPRGWVRKCSSELMVWTPGDVFAKGQGSVSGVTLDLLRAKILSKNVETGAQSLRLSLSPGFVQAVSVQSTTQYVFVISGSLAIGDQPVRDGGFFERPGGEEFPEITAPEGAELFVKTNGPWDVRPA